MFGIKDYLKPQFEVEEKKKAEVAVVRKNNIDIKVQVSGCDFLVTKKTSQTKKTLAVIVSQGLYFIRDEKTSIDTPLFADSLRSFIGQIEEIRLIDDETGEECCWLEGLVKGKMACESLCNLLKCEKLNAYLKSGYVYLLETDFRDYALYPKRDHYDEIFRFISSVFKKLSHEEKRSCATALAKCCFNRIDRNDTILGLLFDPNIFEYFSTADGWGISGTTEFLLECLKTNTYIYHYYFERIVYSQIETGRFGCKTNGSARVFNRKDLQEYLIYGMMNEGGGGGFYSTYADYLYMRDELSKVSNKKYDLFPEYLFSQERRISADYSMYQKELEKVSDEEWKEYVKFMADYEYKSPSSGLMIVAPKEKGDMINEATSQHNCLSSYISRVRDGECMIFFCRKIDAPNKSYVTVEVRSNGKLGQVLAACNKQPNPSAKQFVEEWHNKFFVKKGK